jgi:hypothetical protein
MNFYIILYNIQHSSQAGRSSPLLPDMADKKDYYGSRFERPEGVIRVKKFSRKRALQERLGE